MATSVAVAREIAVRRSVSGSVPIGAAYLLTDLASLSFGIVVGFWCWALVNPAVATFNPAMALAVVFCLLAFAQQELYPGVGLTSVDHTRRIVRSVTLVYLVLTASMFLAKEWWAQSRGGFVASWAVSVASVPLARAMTAHFLRDKPWWGVPVIILGAGKTARLVIENLSRNRVLGLHPVACLDDDLGKHGDCGGVPVVGVLENIHLYAEKFGARYALFAMPGMERARLIQSLERWSHLFSHVLIVPDLFGIASLWVAPRDLGGVLGLEIRHNLVSPFNRAVKRASDVIGAAAGLAAAWPLVALAALWVKCASPGPAFFRQEREGKGGRTVRVWKLRTMHPDAEARLEQHLAADPEARREWERCCKLRNDPRVIPGIGRFARRTSLDEIPQLWNVLSGEMSLVGPRPFPAYHNSMFPPAFRTLRRSVAPGLTGLWQVTERSAGGLEAQARLDTYYVKNWSLWLDLHILARTVRAVLFPKGAY